MKISLIHPSRGRADKSFSITKKWIENSGVELELVLSLDKSDRSINDYYLNYLDVAGIMAVNDNTSVVEATNKAAERATGDILIYLSDDFDCPPNWGLSVLKEFEGEDRPLLLKVHDNLQDFNARVLTIPIMNRLSR